MHMPKFFFVTNCLTEYFTPFPNNYPQESKKLGSFFMSEIPYLQVISNFVKSASMTKAFNK